MGKKEQDARMNATTKCLSDHITTNNNETCTQYEPLVVDKEVNANFSPIKPTTTVASHCVS